MTRIIWPDGGGFVYTPSCNRVERILPKPMPDSECHCPGCEQMFSPQIYYDGRKQMYHSRQCANIDRTRVYKLKKG